MFYITLGTIFKGLPFARSPVSDLFIALYWSFLTSPLGHVKPILVRSCRIVFAAKIFNEKM